MARRSQLGQLAEEQARKGMLACALCQTQRVVCLLCASWLWLQRVSKDRGRGSGEVELAMSRRGSAPGTWPSLESLHSGPLVHFGQYESSAQPVAVRVCPGLVLVQREREQAEEDAASVIARGRSGTDAGVPPSWGNRC